MDIDIFGILVFLWFIFRGLRQGQNAKKEHEKKQRQGRGQTNSSPQTVIEEQPIEREEKEAPTVNPFPDWFPFPFPIDIEVEEPKRKKQRQSKAKPKQVIEKVRQEERRKAERESKKLIVLKEIAIPSRTVDPIVQGEVQWKNESFGLELDRKALVNGVIMAEILGPPKSRKQ